MRHLQARLAGIVLLAFTADSAFAGDFVNLEAKLQNAAGIHNDRFGTTVAIADHHVAVGAPWELTGSVYVFVRDATGWVEQARLAPPSLTPGDKLGASLSFDGATLVAGAPRDSASLATGAAHVFARSGTSWAHQATLVGSDATASARFGSSVSVHGDTAAVGAMFHGAGQGKAYVFTRSGSLWTEQAGLQPPNLGPIDRFGEAIATNGSALAVGSRYFENGTGSPVGGVFLYTLSGSTWTLTQTVLPNPVAGYIAFGTSLAMSADLMMIGAVDDSSISSPNGLAFVYRRNGTHWTERRWLFDSILGTTGNHFGAAVGLDGTRLTVGAPLSGGLSIKEGRAYVYTVRPSSSYCVGGISKHGCQAWLCASGVASATSVVGFHVRAGGVPGKALGMLFFGTHGRQERPWGGTSFQCVVPPVLRAPRKSSTGTLGLCDGYYNVDLNNLWCPTCSKPGHNPGPGAVVQAQYWYRDGLPGNLSHTSLSDAIEFTVGP